MLSSPYTSTCTTRSVCLPAACTRQTIRLHKRQSRSRPSARSLMCSIRRHSRMANMTLTTTLGSSATMTSQRARAIQRSGAAAPSQASRASASPAGLGRVYPPSRHGSRANVQRRPSRLGPTSHLTDRTLTLVPLPVAHRRSQGLAATRQIAATSLPCRPRRRCPSMRAARAFSYRRPTPTQRMAGRAWSATEPWPPHRSSRPC